MDGITDRPFRRMVKRLCPEVLVVTEFLSARDLSQNRDLAEQMMSVSALESPLVVQLYGKDPEAFRAAAILAQELGAAGVDINMGCPAKKVVAHQHGSALLKNPQLAREIVRLLKEALDIPVSVKTRLGWSDANELLPFAHQLSEEGLDALLVHGRTYEMKFTGQADWSAIHRLKTALPLKVVGNGDLANPSQAVACLGNLDGVMIGRAAMSDPGLPGRIHHELHKNMGPPSNVTAEDWMIYLEESLQCYPQSFACRRMRKTLIGLLGPHADPALQQLARTVENAQDIQRVLSGVKFKEHKTHAFQATPGHEGESTVPSAIEI